MSFFSRDILPYSLPLDLPMFFHASSHKVRFYPTLTVLLIAGLSAWPARAQGVLKSEIASLELPVDQRIPAELQPEGLSYHSFTYLTQLKLDGRYDDNILAANRNEQSDYILALYPQITVRKQYDGHVFMAGADALIERYANANNENKKNANLFLRGSFNANSKWQFPFGLTFNQQDRNRSSPQQQGLTEEPVTITKAAAQTGITRRFNRLSLSLLGRYSEIELSDETSAATKTPVIFSDSNQKSWAATLRTRYEFPRGTTGEGAEHILFADFLYEKQDYLNRQFENDGFTGDSGDRANIGALLGFETSYKGLLFANLAAGIIYQDFDDQDFKSVKRFDLSADAAYNILPKLTLKFKADRDIQQDNDFSQGIVKTGFDLGGDYELLHNAFIESNFSYTDFDYLGSDRTNEDYETSLALRYYHSRNLETNFRVKYFERTGNDPTTEFNRLIFMLGFTGKL